MTFLHIPDSSHFESLPEPAQTALTTLYTKQPDSPIRTLSYLTTLIALRLK